VRQQDAHAWVEVYLPHSGWVMMDPTPASEDSFGEMPGAWLTFGRMLDSVRLRWSRVFVQYSTADQLTMVQGIQAGGVTAKNKARDILASIVDPLAAMMGTVIDHVYDYDLMPMAEGGLVLLAIGLLVWLSLKKLWKHGFSVTAASREEPEVMSLYKRMIVQLARKGLLKPATMGPLEFVRVTREQWADAVLAVTTITDIYCRGRFGKCSVTQEEYRIAQDQLRRLMVLERR